MLKRAQLFDLHDVCEYYDVGPIALLSGRLTEIHVCLEELSFLT